MDTRREFLKNAAAVGVVAAFARSEAAAPADRRGVLSGSAGMAQTVLGPLDASELGFALPHEHVADAPGVLARWPKAWGGREGLVARAVDRLRIIRAAGISTVVDLTTYDSGAGRDIRFLEEVSRKAGVHIIAATGQRFLPPQSSRVVMHARTIAGLADFFMSEIERGIDGTTIKAGVIKIGIVAGRPTALEEVGLRAAARASKAGLPIRIHTDSRLRAGESAAAILEEAGVSPARVSFDHSDDSGDMDYYLGLLKRGYSLGMDHVHRGLAAGISPSFQRRVECIKRLVDAGFADQLFLSGDSEFGGSLLPQRNRDWRENIDPADGLLFTVRRLLPALGGLGVSPEQIHAMTVRHPMTFFGRTAAA